MPHEGDPDGKQGSSSNGESPCGIEVNAMAHKSRKHAKKKQRLDVLSWVTRLAAATFWVLRLVFLLWDRFSR